MQRDPNGIGPALSIKGLQKRFGDTVAVDGIDLEVGRGECFGLLGPNGAGKTTTIEICEGLTPADGGEVGILGLNHAQHADEIRARIGISLQETKLPEKLTVVEILRLFRSFYPKGRSVEAAIAAVQLGEKRNARSGNLSGGQRQRLALACALVGDPELFFLDEPTTGLDPQSRRQLWDLIEELKAAGRTILITTHYMEEAERLCDRVAIVDHGKVIAQGTPRALIAMLGAEHVVECTVEPTAPPVADLEAIAGVTKATAVDGRVQLEVSEVHRAIPELLALVARQGGSLTSLTTHNASLEDVFVHLTGRQLRDG